MEVSIIITSYNYARYIGECLESCLNQQGIDSDYEVIVVDDGSDDNTPDLLSRYTHRLLRVIKMDNSGVEAASNYAFAAARGRYIVRVDADDVLASNYLSIMLPLLKSDFSFYYPDYTIIDENSVVQEGVSLPDFNAAEVMARGDFLATGTIYPSKLLGLHGAYNNKVRNCGLENYELIIKLIAAGVTGFHVAKPLFKYRRHRMNMSAKRKESIITYGRNLFKENGLGSYRTNQYHPYKLVLPKD